MGLGSRARWREARGATSPRRDSPTTSGAIIGQLQPAGGVNIEGYGYKMRGGLLYIMLSNDSPHYTLLQVSYAYDTYATMPAGTLVVIRSTKNVTHTHQQ